MTGSRLVSKATMMVMLLTALATALPAQTGSRGRSQATDAIERMLFSPRLVMVHQEELGLTARQKEMLVAEMQATQSELVPLQLEMAGLGGALAKLVAQPVVDEQRALAKADEIMALESEIKRRHLRLVLRIKNILTPEQQATLRSIRQRQRARR